MLLIDQNDPEIKAQIEAARQDLIEHAKRGVSPESCQFSEAERFRFVRNARGYLANKWEPTQVNKHKNLIPDLKRDLYPGWLLPYIFMYDARMWGRWDYWFRTELGGRLLDEPIPTIDWELDRPLNGIKNNYVDGGIGFRHLSDCLDAVKGEERLSWVGWSSWKCVDYFLDWFLYGVGHIRELPEEPYPGASMRLYQTFNLEPFMAWPYDYWGDLLADQKVGKQQGFYPTPLDVVELMVRIQTQDLTSSLDHSVYDSCVGTGRTLLAWSNYSLCLYGQELVSTFHKASYFNAYLYAPWMARPISFLSQSKPKPQGEVLPFNKPTYLLKAAA